ncbi:hypothetical protein Taro_048056 [Colocasia esculenta]|uniref:Uncharacterized protein n=1 Tax=Colocasia esculenta TaxID=4460 RepID=A0A843WUR1_COLES|nr:hypothetical protein [Colocasia esculenta]
MQGGNLLRSLPEGPKSNPAVGHTPTCQSRPRKHPRRAKSCRALLACRDTIATGRATATSGAGRRDNSLSRRATGSRHNPYRDDQPRRDKVASDRGDAFSDVAMCSVVATSAGGATVGMLHPAVPHMLQTLQPWGGEHGESSKHKHSTKTNPQRGLHDELATSSSLQRHRSHSARAAGRSTKLHHRRKTRGRPLPSEKRGKGGKERKRKKGKLAKAFSLRPPKRDGAGRCDTNLIATTAQIATRTHPFGAPRQPNILVCHAYHSDRRQTTKKRKHCRDPLTGRDKNVTQKAVATGMTVATGTPVATRPVIPHTTESQKARDVTIMFRI